MKSVLITGADGFIGGALLQKLKEGNTEIYCTVYPSGKEKEICENEKVHVIEVDLKEIEILSQKLPNGIDVMYHMAWIGVNPELRDDAEVQLSNIKITMNCMKLAVEKKIKKVIIPGSTNEYLYYGKPINNKAIPSPNSLYGATKVSLRFLCSSFLKKTNVEFVYAIITGIYGENRRDNNVIFYTIECLLKKEKPNLTKLEQLWDYVYIDDVVEALECIGVKGKDGAVYAIGHGDNWPLSKYIEIIHDIIDKSLPLGIGDVPYDGDLVPSSCVDLHDIYVDTGFVPKVDFTTGITHVINCIKKGKEM